MKRVSLGAGGFLQAVAADAKSAPSVGAFSFVQISDSHIGFSRPENPDVAGALEKTVDAINRIAASASSSPCVTKRSHVSDAAAAPQGYRNGATGDHLSARVHKHTRR